MGLFFQGNNASESALKRGRVLIAKHRQLILYGLIGACGATIDLVLYAIIVHYTDIQPFIASFISVSAGITNNFFLNARHNFKVSDNLPGRFVKFYGVGLGGAVLSAILIVLLFDVMGINALIAKIITVPPVVLLQFIINKHVSFSQKPQSENAG